MTNQRLARHSGNLKALRRGLLSYIANYQP
jgi:hypothetical protein